MNFFRLHNCYPQPADLDADELRAMGDADDEQLATFIDSASAGDQLTLIVGWVECLADVASELQA